MRIFFTSVIIFEFLEAVNLQVLHVGNNQTRENLPAAVTLSEANEKVAPNTVSDTMKKEKLSVDTLLKLEEFAKNISYSVGIFKDKENELDEEPEVRRSVHRKITITTESDVMRNILNTFESVEDKLAALDKIEYMVHQYDVAVNFASMGGIEILSSFLFSSNDRIASSVASVLGVAMQSNPSVQKMAVKLDVGGNLLKLLSHNSPSVVYKVVFAIGSLLRNMPEAQESFFTVNGFAKLHDVLKNHQIPTNTKLKVIDLFNDLFTELQTSQLYSRDENSRKVEKLIGLFVHDVKAYDICKLVPTFLDFEGFDTHQRVVAAMTSLSSICSKDYEDQKTINRIKQLVKIYSPDEISSATIYPDVDIRTNLHVYLKSLLKVINHENINKDNDSEIKKSEL